MVKGQTQEEKMRWGKIGKIGIVTHTTKHSFIRK